MKQAITFHKHEMASAQILEKRLQTMGWTYEEIQLPKRMVELHQIRFYESTTDKTYRVFLRRLGKGNLHEFLQLLTADRLGNLYKANLPVKTQYFNNLEQHLDFLDQTTIYEQDLCLRRWDLSLMGVPRKELSRAIDNMTAIVQLRPSRNNYLFLTRFIQNNYLEKKNDRSQGLPDWN